MTFEFASPSRVVFGPGTLRQIGPLAREFGNRVLIVTGRNAARAQPLFEHLASSDVAAVSFTIPGEPTTDDVVRGVADARKAACDGVIGFGGGSAIDAAKAIAALLTNDGELLDYLEVIGRAAPLSRSAAPCIAIPTTAGTGAEVTRNAVLASPAHRVKVSLRSPHLLPRIALVDPELTHDLPPSITTQTGLDALTQLIEPYVSSRANPLTDALCVEGIRRAGSALRRAVENGRDAAAREDMALASLFGGFALANAGLGAVHGFAGPIGGMFPAPHGAICGGLLPHVMSANLRALRQRAPASSALGRYEAVARLLTGQPNATADDGVRWVHELVRALSLPTLAHFGVTPDDAPVVVAAAEKASSMKANPLPLTPAELSEILLQAL